MRITNIKSSGKAGTWRQKAFTLVELLLVLTILAILAGVVLPKLTGNTERARKVAAKSQIVVFGTALSAFEIDNGYFPKGQKGLNDLVIKPREAQNWRGPYLEKEIPLDPWNNAYVYECPGRHNPTSYDVSCKALDGEIIANWTTQPVTH